MDPSAEDLRRAVVARAMVTAAVESAKESGNATSMDKALSIARIEVSRLQERVDIAKQAKDTEAAVNSGHQHEDDYSRRWTKPKSFKCLDFFPVMTDDDPGSRSSVRNASVLILTDEPEFARLLTACWQAERQAPGITVLSSELWKDHEAVPHDLVVVGPVT